MVLTGKQIIAEGIVEKGFDKRYDDGDIPSYGMDPAGYTLRPYAPMGRLTLEYIDLPAGDSLTLQSRRKICMPVNRIGYLNLKSTYTRRGLILVTDSVVDPGYSGKLTFRLFNSDTGDRRICLVGGLVMLTVHEMAEAVEPYNGRWQR